VQRMAKLVEHGGHVGKGDERGLARRGLWQIRHVVNHRKGAQKLGLAHEDIHPGATVLVVALEIIAIEKRQRLAVRIRDFEGTNVRLIDRNVLAFLERNSVELMSGVED